MSKWYEKAGEHSDVIISSRIRLARNIAEYPFPCRLNRDMQVKVIDDIEKALKKDSFNDYKFKKLNLQDLTKSSVQSLVERHLISPEFSRLNKLKIVFLSEDESISIMVNEEDHIRLQIMKEGLDLEKIYNIADKIDTELDKILKFAFNEQLGYLTQCPTNIGTGMRASVMLHLPALREVGVIDKISSNLIKLGLTIRGLYGEGTNPKGDIYQISNQVTLGISEQTALKNLNDITMQLISQERTCRKDLSKNIRIIDTIGRSLGILKSAKVISNDEFMKLISNIRFGLSIGIIKGISYDLINEITIYSQPFTLIRSESSVLSPLERDKKRALIVNEKFQNAQVI